MSDSRVQADSGHHSAPVCTACQSQDVRSSRSSYPRDVEVLAEIAGSFWRCRNCGARFLSPLAPERTRQRRSHQGSRGHKDPFRRRINFARAAKRWIFPVLVILATIVAVLYILDRRAPPEERIFPRVH